MLHNRTKNHSAPGAKHFKQRGSFKPRGASRFKPDRPNNSSKQGASSIQSPGPRKVTFKPPFDPRRRPQYTSNAVTDNIASPIDAVNEAVPADDYIAFATTIKQDSDLSIYFGSSDDDDDDSPSYNPKPATSSSSSDSIASVDDPTKPRIPSPTSSDSDNALAIFHTDPRSPKTAMTQVDMPSEVQTTHAPILCPHLTHAKCFNFSALPA